MGTRLKSLSATQDLQTAYGPQEDIRERPTTRAGSSWPVLVFVHSALPTRRTLVEGNDRIDMKIATDNPIRNSEDDVLGRESLAHLFSDQLLTLDVTEGLVVGILGPWGSGKTSFINLARKHLQGAGITILDFNPWMYSGAEQLVGFFFTELSGQLKVRVGLAEVGRRLEDYGKFLPGMGWLPVMGPWMERARVAMKGLGHLFANRSQGLGKRRQKVANALSILEKPIAVIVDDIDRLTTSEIQDIFKLIRLTASFPNVIYIAAFDRTRIEDALTEQGIPGKDYLEKILQLGIDLPAVPPHVLDKEVFRAITEVLSDVDNGRRFHDTAWPDVFVEVIRPLLRNIRDVRRYVTAIHGTVRGLDGQVALVDVLALEAIRVFLPNSFREIHKTIEGLTTTGEHGLGSREDPPHLQEQIDQLIKVSGDEHAGVIRQLIQHLFPAARRHIGASHYGREWKSGWLTERRVAHEDVLRLYLERVVGEGLQSFTEAEQAWAKMTDAEALDSYLRSLDRKRLQDVISYLEAYQDKFAPEYVVTGSTVLLNLLPVLPERQLGMLDFGPRLAVTRVVLRLVRSLKTPEAIEDTVRRILPKLTTLSAKSALITIIGYQENAGHKLVSESAAHRFEEDWRGEVRAATDDFLAGEYDLLTTFLLVRANSGPEEPTVTVPHSPSVTLTLLKSARSDVRSQTVGSHAVRRSPRLQWPLLVELYGSEDTLRRRIEELKASPLNGTDDILELAERYVGGWRPRDFGKD